jgi:hypothetical protein
VHYKFLQNTQKDNEVIVTGYWTERITNSHKRTIKKTTVIVTGYWTESINSYKNQEVYHEKKRNN